jgi:phosphomannomutase / phosphoglucomutase
MRINPQIFREYDIRGRVGLDLDAEVVELLGRAIGTLWTRRGERQACVGRDCRKSSPELRDALIRGILSTGVEVLDVGVCPTPLVYFALKHYNRPAGVMVTGSHNPAEYNGLKISSRGSTIFGDDIQELRELIKQGRFERGEGRLETGEIIGPYKEYCLKQVKISRPLRVVVDAGNGTGGVVAVPILRKMGMNVHALYCEMDGAFPNHHPDPTVVENLTALCEKVKETGADVGLAFDGDADRLGAVVLDGGQPRILWGDELMILFSRDLLAQSPGAAIVGEVKCSKNLYDEIERRGGRPIMWKAGHSLIKAKMREENALLGGEMSGHLFFADRYFGYDDAVYAGLRLLEIAARLPPMEDGQTSALARALSDLPKTFATPEIRLDCAEEEKFGLVSRAQQRLRDRHPVNDIDGVRITFPDGWGLIRASNTQPVIVLRAEAQSVARRDEILSYLKSTLSELATDPSDHPVAQSA